MTDALRQIWDAATTPVAAPEQPVVLAAGLVALAVVLVGPVWRTARHVITIAHEAAHGLVAPQDTAGPGQAADRTRRRRNSRGRRPVGPGGGA